MQQRYKQVVHTTPRRDTSVQLSLGLVTVPCFPVLGRAGCAVGWVTSLLTAGFSPTLAHFAHRGETVWARYARPLLAQPRAVRVDRTAAEVDSTC